MEEDDLFYHYCSNEAFCSIINNKSIRLSSLALSNDKTEGKLVSRIFKDLAEKESVKMDDLVEYIKGVEENCHALGFCLSAQDDLLSQWRGYADNASGVAIGFSERCLEQFVDRKELCCKTAYVQFAQIEYDHDKQKELMGPVFKKMKDAVDRGGLRLLSERGVSAEENNKRLDAYNELRGQTMNFFPETFLLKDEGFSEEREWRLLVQLDENDLVGYGCKHRICDGKIVPYKDFQFDCSGIREVVLGPRNVNSEQMVTSFLNSKEVRDVNVRKSKIPYC
ncbi:MAG: DUF2971 domain-containing protein [Kiritimatiellales bacterium]